MIGVRFVSPRLSPVCVAFQHPSRALQGYEGDVIKRSAIVYVKFSPLRHPDSHVLHVPRVVRGGEGH